MTKSWISKHREDIRFILMMVMGISLIVVGLVDSEPGLIALGAGAIGYPGIKEASKR